MIFVMQFILLKEKAWRRTSGFGNPAEREAFRNTDSGQIIFSVEIFSCKQKGFKNPKPGTAGFGNPADPEQYYLLRSNNLFSGNFSCKQKGFKNPKLATAGFGNPAERWIKKF
jgi:hypothetical protein